MEEYKCPELIATASSKGFYKEVEDHPHYEKIKECLKNDSACDSNQKSDKG